MPLTRREKTGYATAGVGGALVYGGAQTAERGIQSGLKLGGLPHKEGRPALPGLRAMKHSRGIKGAGKARALYGTGNALRTAGAVGLLTGAAEVQRGRKWRKDNPNNTILKGMLREGISGNFAANRQKLSNLREEKPLGALAIPTAIGVGGAAGGSKIGHEVLNRARKGKLKGSGKRAGLTALAGAAGIAASAPVSNKVLERTYPEYKVTPTGVQRRKTAPVRPSAKAAIFNQKDGQSAFRRNTVPTDVRKADMTDRQKRAAIFAAGSIPGIGDFSAASTAGKLAKPENRNKAFATQLTGNLGGSMAGAAAGAVAAGEIARKSPTARAKMTAGNEWVGEKKKAVLKPITNRLPLRNDKPSAAGAAQSTWRKKVNPGRLVPTAAKTRYGKVGGAVALGALGGQMVGGQSGGYKATSINLARDKRPVAKALLVINQGQKVDHQANRAAARRKKISGGMSTAGGAVGTAAFGMMALAKKPKLAAKFPKLADQARDTGLVGGGIGGANALYFGRLQRKEAKALTQQRSTPDKTKVYKVGKSFLASRFAWNHPQGSKYVRAVDLTPDQRISLRNRKGTPIPRPGPSSRVQERVNPERLRQSPSIIAETRPLKRGGGRASVYLSPKASESTLRHEAGHAAPRRNSERFHERISQSKVAQGREEARADYLAGLDRTKTLPHGGPYGQGYDEVMGRMKRAKTRQPFAKNATIQRHARKGQANVRLSTLEPYRRAPGLRWKNSSHTAEIAQHMRRKGYDKTKPVHVQLWNGKEVFIDDGAHRMWAADMSGRKIVPIKITQHTGRNPRKSSGALNRTFDDVRTARFHTQRRRTMNMSDRQLQRLAANKATGWQAKQNAKWSARGEKRANGRGRLVATTMT